MHVDDTQKYAEQRRWTTGVGEPIAEFAPVPGWPRRPGDRRQQVHCFLSLVWLPWLGSSCSVCMSIHQEGAYTPAGIHQHYRRIPLCSIRLGYEGEPIACCLLF